MATLEELRKKRLQEIQSRQDSERISIAREKRLAELKTRNSTFTEVPAEIQETIDTGSTAGEAFKRTAAVNTLPAVGSLAMGLKGAELGTAIVPGWGTAIGFLGGTIVGFVVTKETQDKALEVTMGDEWKQNLDKTIIEDRKTHPFATLLGEAAPSLIAFKPSPTTLKQAFNLSKRAITDKASLATHLKTLQGKTELDSLVNTGIGAGIDFSIEGYQQVREGDVNAIRLLGSALIGGAISNPNRIGVKMGFSSSGDAIINEYDKFGSQTPAAKIVTHGDIPILDRSTDSLLMERRETSAILRGESEMNRFTDPRILQAEKIAGTIDRDVTPDSDLNIYRLDGRSGQMRVGERVTANPHIADVFGGRINPEATVKAGDLVRTSKGDYIYIPKSEIVARPKLPPVSTVVDKTIREQVISREKLQSKELKAKGREAIRKAEEPARLQREAEERVAKQQADAEAKFAEETKQAEMTKLNLEESIEKTRVETQKKIIDEAKRVKFEKEEINKIRDKAIVSVTKQKRKSLNDAKLAHTERLSKLKTPKQKVKEMIRFTNENNRIRDKAKKDEAKLRADAIKEREKIKDQKKEIKKQGGDIVRDSEKRIKAILKPKLEVIKLEVIKEDSKSIKKSVEKVVPSKEKSNAPKKIVEENTKKTPEPVEKTTTIGTKVVKSKSIIKNAVEEARSISQKAQEADQDVTYQMGTTFVEQAELSAKLIVEKGFDDALKFAKEATDAELNKLNINRSALYRTLRDVANAEGEFTKYRDDFEDLSLITADEVSEAAQKSSLHRMAIQNDPFRAVVELKKTLLESEKETRGSVFNKEVDELYAKIQEAGTEEDLNKIIKENLC
jgi:hypothetical protein